jgi:hypothetical protein
MILPCQSTSINKHRPQLIDYAGLDKSDPIATLQAAMDAAENYFQLEKYLTPAGRRPCPSF